VNNKNNENKLSDNLEKEIKIKIWDNRTKNIKIYQTLYKILCGFFNGYLIDNGIHIYNNSWKKMIEK
jgi:hypothetical protein